MTIGVKHSVFSLLASAAMLAGCAALSVEGASAADETVPGYISRLPQDEVIYFALPDRFANGDDANDRGGIAGGPQDHGYDPTHKGYYHGGDLKGLTEKLDYVKGLGASAIWLGPIYQNKAVQGAPGGVSAGYHGYWITDFTRVDAHFGEDNDMRAFVDAAHARDMKVYLDIITNHTADVIAYRECHDPEFEGVRSADGCEYRSKADYPWTTRGGPDGEPINDGFMGDEGAFQTDGNYANLTDPNYAYTTYVPEDEKDIKKPAWLNDPIYYHNRGNTSFEGENSLYGDFFGLDDVMTSHPRVVEGFIDIYKDWITRYRIDGFRIDTARHVNPEFWRAFNPAMIDHAASLGIPNFHVFGEVFEPDPGKLARFTRVDRFPAVLDFAFQDVVTQTLVNGAPASAFADLFRADDLYGGGADAALALPTFIGNHDIGRFSGFAEAAFPNASEDERFKRVRLAHALMTFARGAPVIYYGDEQGFVSDGNDQLAREDMFESQVDVYNDNDLIGTDATTADDNFDVEHPLYKAIAEIAAIYHAHKPLRRGRQIVRLAETDGGVLALSRMGEEGEEYLAVFNLRKEPRILNVEVGPDTEHFEALIGACASSTPARGSYPVEIEGLDFLVCRKLPSQVGR
ncbi:MAG: alpha-amylase family glycosyl hydrolase [Pseudomonadota bacterium]